MLAEQYEQLKEDLMNHMIAQVHENKSSGEGTGANGGMC
jgi:hypothetical protein